MYTYITQIDLYNTNSQAYTFGIHVRHEKGRGAQGKGRKGIKFQGGAQRPSILV
jgi:hypothetical protein